MDFRELEYSYGPTVAQAVLNTLTLFNQRFKFLGIGRNRAVYTTSSGKYVMKVPVTSEGFTDNQRESRIYKSYPNSIYARAHLHHILPVGIPVLFMEHIQPTIKTLNELPSWVMSIDGAQVGLDQNGNLKAYDYGDQ